MRFRLIKIFLWFPARPVRRGFPACTAVSAGRFSSIGKEPLAHEAPIGGE